MCHTAKAFLATTKVQRNIFRTKTFSCLFVAFLRVINGFLGILVLRIGNCKTKVAKVLSSLMDIREVYAGQEVAGCRRMKLTFQQFSLYL